MDSLSKAKCKTLLNNLLLLQDFHAFGIIRIEQLINSEYGKEQIIRDGRCDDAFCRGLEQLQQ